MAVEVQTAQDGQAVETQVAQEDLTVGTQDDLTVKAQV